ncbi:MAG: DNA (cytosine-5-)-methyltransferase [Nitrososphaerota archaeon]|jgi:DNA (cytosine-5)-methyltransferase 1|nr:DNA (cytosine-5-)-methyltransferase [Nitrososphaerota archaeon]
MHDIQVCELFAGIGGFRLGLENASSQFHTVYANEHDQYAAAIYRHHWPNSNLQEIDVKKVQTQNVPSFDLLVAGFPCQPYSNAGARKGTKDPRGLLYPEILRFAKEKQPKLLLLENVPGLLCIEQGGVFKEILWSLHELGYTVEWRILDSKFFRVPQQRRRVFIIGYLATFARGGETVFPIPQSGKSYFNKISKRQTTCTCLDANYPKGAGGGRTLIIQTNMHKNKNKPVLRVNSEVMPTLCSRMGTGGNNVPMVLRERESIRRLTPIECERLQGFPNNWTKHGLTPTGETVPISNTQRYKTLGNAVTTTVISAIGKLLIDFLKKQQFFGYVPECKEASI